ncbi:MAG TPA: MSMEG_0567/Sll0786 family nitrogen starvation N-acetyltransferase [Pseudonocardia sp.]|jgi:putative N-acetyltransferase (TIGR04045 family)
MRSVDVCELLVGTPPRSLRPRVEVADGPALAAYRALRRDVFVAEQGLFSGHDRDDVDDDPRAVVLVARDNRLPERPVVGGVRLAPATEPDLGWWVGSRLAVHPDARRGGVHIGAALVRAACATVEAAGALRFEATVQAANEGFFTRLGWQRLAGLSLFGAPHVRMRWPVGRVDALVTATKAPLHGLLAALSGAPTGFVGDDGAPVPGSDLVAACDAIVPAMVERDPEWAGWCSVLVNVNDLAAMGATPVGLLDAVGASDAAAAARALSGLRDAAEAWGVPVLGGHTQLGVPASLSVTALGRARRPVPAGGGRPGDEVRLTADLGGWWRPGYTGRQWDSTSSRRPEELRAQQRALAGGAGYGASPYLPAAASPAGPGAGSPAGPGAAPAAAKDVSMAGLAGTLGMLAEASGCGADLDVAAVPRPAEATVGDWLTCFPGYAMITADRVARPLDAPGTSSAVCGRLRPGAGVRLRWPDGEYTQVVAGAVTGMGAA